MQFIVRKAALWICTIPIPPTYAIWLYAFKHFDGILGSFHTNKQGIASQIMKRILESKSSAFVTYEALKDERFQAVLPKESQMYVASTLYQQPCSVIQLLELPFGPMNILLDTLKAFISTMVETIGPYREKVFTDLEYM